MNAVLTPETDQDLADLLAPAADSPVKAATATATDANSSIAVTPRAKAEPLSFGAAQARVMPLALVAVFAVATIGQFLYKGDLFGSMGLGLYLSMWLGGGFGFLGGGILWAIGEMEADGAHQRLRRGAPRLEFRPKAETRET